jgi:hypothetical protein
MNTVNQRQFSNSIGTTTVEKGKYLTKLLLKLFFEQYGGKGFKIYKEIFRKVLDSPTIPYQVLQNIQINLYRHDIAIYTFEDYFVLTPVSKISNMRTFSTADLNKLILNKGKVA